MDSSPDIYSLRQDPQLSPEYGWSPMSPSPTLMFDNTNSSSETHTTMPSEPESGNLFDSPRSPSPSYQIDSDSNPMDSPGQSRPLSQSFLLDWNYPLISGDNRSSSPGFPMTSPVRMDSPAYLEVEEEAPRTNPSMSSPYYPPQSPSSIEARLGSPWAQSVGYPEMAINTENRSMSPLSDSLERPFSPLDLIINEEPAADGRAQFDHDHSYGLQGIDRLVDNIRREMARSEHPAPVIQPNPSVLSIRLFRPVPGASDSMESTPSPASPAAMTPPGTDESEPLTAASYSRLVREAADSRERWRLDSSGPIPIFQRFYSPVSPTSAPAITEPGDIPVPPTTSETARSSHPLDTTHRGTSVITPNQTAPYHDGSPVAVYRQLRRLEGRRMRMVSPSPEPQPPSPPPSNPPRYELRSYRAAINGSLQQSRERAISPELREPPMRLHNFRRRPRSPSPDDEDDQNEGGQPQRGVIVSPNNTTSFLHRLRRARTNMQRLGGTSVTPVRIRSPPVRASAVLPPPPEPVSLNNSTKKKISSKVKETMAKVGIDNGQARSSRALTPDACSVCLDVPKASDASLTYPCLHTFCNECISVWVKTKSSCPNCQAKVTRILYNLRGESDYDVKGVEDCNNLMTAPPFEGDFFELFLHLHQRVANHSAEFRQRQPVALNPVREAYQVPEVFARNFPELPNALQQERIFPGPFEVSRVSFRRAVYAQHLIGGERTEREAMTFEEAQNTSVPQEIGAAMISRDGYARRLRPWLRREVMAATLPEASNTMREHVFAVIAHQTSQPTTYEAFATSCQQWLRDGREGIFWREMLHFINRRVDMGVWDQSRCYYSVDGTLYDPAHRQRTESDEEVQVVNVVLRDPRRRRNVGNVELIVVSDDEISVSTNGGRTIDSTRATNGTGDSDREMNGLSSETDTDATEFRDHWDREIETSDDHMDVSEDSRARAQSSRRRDTPDPRSPSLDRNIQREIQRQQPMVVHSINSIHMRRQQRRGPESRQLHRQETSRPVRSSASSRSAAERRRSVRQGRSTTTTSRSSRVMRHGLRGTTRSTRPRDDEDMDTEGEGDPLPVPIPSRYPRNRILQRTARGDSPDPRHRSFAPRPRASGSMERRPMSGRLRSGGSRRNRY